MGWSFNKEGDVLKSKSRGMHTTDTWTASIAFIRAQGPLGGRPASPAWAFAVVERTSDRTSQRRSAKFRTNSSSWKVLPCGARHAHVQTYTRARTCTQAHTHEPGDTQPHRGRRHTQTHSHTHMHALYHLIERPSSARKYATCGPKKRHRPWLWQCLCRSHRRTNIAALATEPQMVPLLQEKRCSCVCACGCVRVCMRVCLHACLQTKVCAVVCE